LDRLDRAASEQQTFLQRFWGYRYIRSLDGAKLRLDEYAFEPATLDDLLLKLGGISR
jgi:hypothetical protein